MSRVIVSPEEVLARLYDGVVEVVDLGMGRVLSPKVATTMFRWEKEDPEEHERLLSSITGPKDAASLRELQGILNERGREYYGDFEISYEDVVELAAQYWEYWAGDHLIARRNMFALRGDEARLQQVEKQIERLAP